MPTESCVHNNNAQRVLHLNNILNNNCEVPMRHTDAIWCYWSRVTDCAPNYFSTLTPRENFIAIVMNLSVSAGPLLCNRRQNLCSKTWAAYLSNIFRHPRHACWHKWLLQTVGNKITCFPVLAKITIASQKASWETQLTLSPPLTRYLVNEEKTL